MGAASTCEMVLLSSTLPLFAVPPPLTRDGGYLLRAACHRSKQPGRVPVYY